MKVIPLPGAVRRSDRPLPEDLTSKIPWVRDQAYANLTRAPAPTPGVPDLGWLTPLRRQIGRLEVPLIRLGYRLGIYICTQPENLETLRYFRAEKDQSYPLSLRERQILDRQVDLKEAVAYADVDAVARHLEKFEGPARAVAVDLVLRRGNQELHQALWSRIEADIEARPFFEWVTQGLKEKDSSEAAWRLTKFSPRISPQKDIWPFSLLEGLLPAIQRQPEALIHALLSLAYPQGEILPDREGQGILNMIRAYRPAFLSEFWSIWTHPASRQVWIETCPGQLPELVALVRSLHLQEQPAAVSCRNRRRS